MTKRNQAYLVEQHVLHCGKREETEEVEEGGEANATRELLLQQNVLSNMGQGALRKRESEQASKSQISGISRHTNASERQPT
jgi:hypothetical protein